MANVLDKDASVNGREQRHRSNALREVAQDISEALVAEMEASPTAPAPRSLVVDALVERLVSEVVQRLRERPSEGTAELSAQRLATRLQRHLGVERPARRRPDSRERATIAKYNDLDALVKYVDGEEPGGVKLVIMNFND